MQSCLAGSFESLHYTTEIYPPYNYIEQGRLTGLSVEILRRIWDELAVAPQKIDVLPWARAYYDLEHQGDRVLFAMAQKKSRLNKFQWACPIIARHNGALIALKSSRITIKDISDLKQYVIGTIRDGSIEEDLIAIQGGRKSNIVRNISLAANLSLLNKGRIQLLAHQQQASPMMITQLGYNTEDYEVVYVLKSLPICFAFSLAVEPGLIEKFQQALTKVINTGEYQQLKEQYFPE
ncbi:substrate-binding periplasmic protein [Thalassomonas haliotis]|uniref:Transporter substrate-binding domain-containing protein n=1 Tax=Thalassomonas haliotis TaxID=485448 RepID=A0ABY7V9M9_9GAMM|nr:transporter substrate-binding domain-containing protein [Thalassomonas haliotis]WDE09990.1 transporter substrate-binding domain-containing protein [Thalassomonas haliotis]